MRVVPCETLGGCSFRMIGHLYAPPGVLLLPKVNNMRRKPVMPAHTTGGPWRMGSARVKPQNLILVLLRRRSIREKTDARTIHHFPNPVHTPNTVSSFPPPASQQTSSNNRRSPPPPCQVYETSGAYALEFSRPCNLDDKVWGSVRTLSSLHTLHISSVRESLRSQLGPTS